MRTDLGRNMKEHKAISKSMKETRRSVRLGRALAQNQWTAILFPSETLMAVTYTHQTGSLSYQETWGQVGALLVPPKACVKCPCHSMGEK